MTKSVNVPRWSTDPTGAEELAACYCRRCGNLF